MSSQKSSGRV